jgi:hypothetical protein
MKHGLNEKALAFGEAIFNYVKANRIPKVFLVCRWQGNDMSNGNFEQAFINTVNAFRAINVKVFVMLQVPSHKVDVPKKLALNALLQKDDLGWRTTVEEHQQTHAKLIQLSKNLGSETCVFLDPAPAFLEPDGDHYGVSANGESLYVDHHHLTKHAARTKLYPLLKPALADLSQLATRPQEANTYGSIPRDAVLGSRAP